ncbi:MAG: DNA-binding response regulator [Acidimicrobiales bacterium]|nr:MAG: DNA-binding response regulator [Acidimicrobiales bacterium]
MRVLVVEDEDGIREAMVARLNAAGYAVDATADGKEGLYYALEYPVDVAVIDIGLPGITGIELIRAAREQGRNFPVLILTARGRWQDKVEGLEAGADDYLVKPFHDEELLARLRALVRRAGGWTRDTLRAGPVALDTRAQSIAVADAPVDVTAYEYKVLEYLMLHAGEVVSKATLGEHVYGEDLDPDSNVLEVLIGRLRRKIDPDRSLAPIETLRGRGYRFALAREAES